MFPIFSPAGYTDKPYLAWRINYRDMQKEMRSRFDKKLPRRTRLAVQDTARGIALMTALSIKQYMRQNSIKTSGRLIASIGYYTPEDLTGAKDYGSQSTPADALLVPQTRGNVYYYYIGTKVPYAWFVDQGVRWAPRDNTVGQITVYSPKYKKKIEVGPHIRPATNFMAEGTNRASRQKKAQQKIFEESMAWIKRIWKQGTTWTR